MKPKIRFRHRLEYAGLRTVQALLTAFPIAWVGAAAKGILRVVFRLCWPVRAETVSRVREVFGPETPIAVCREIARTSVWNLLMNFVEIFHAGRMDADYLRAHMEGTDAAKATLQALIDKHGGVVIALPHMGNWDLAGVACAHFGIPLMALARAQNNPLVEAWLVRNRLGNFEAVDRRYPSSFVRIAHHLKSGGALRLDASHHRLTLGDPLLPDLEADAEADAKRLTQAVWDLFERRIRANPGQWFWHNRRWILTPLYTQTRHKHG